MRISAQKLMVLVWLNGQSIALISLSPLTQISVEGQKFCIYTHQNVQMLYIYEKSNKKLNGRELKFFLVTDVIDSFRIEQFY